MAPATTSHPDRVPEADRPLRGELLGADRLASAARSLARSQTWVQIRGRRRTPLSDIVNVAERDLTAAYQRLSADSRENIPVSPGAEWLLDNYYLIEEQIQLVRDDLPAGYGAELPRLESGSYAGLPRVFDLAIHLIMHTDSRVDRAALDLFVSAFQDAAPLTIGEIWAVPIMLRVTLVENLRRLARRILSVHQSTVAGDRFADKLIVAAEQGDVAVQAMLAELDRAHADPPAPLIVRLSQRLAGQDVALAPLSDWLETQLARQERSLEQLALATHQIQAADQVSIANAITSIRFLDALEWRDF